MERELSRKDSFSTFRDDLLAYQSYQNGIYNGNTHKGVCHEKGVFWWDSGELYFGEWHEAKIQGEGILFFPYGGYLKGFFFKNKINGAAFLKFPNGDFYEGIWRHGKLDGKCFKYFAALDRWALCTYSKGVFQNCLKKSNGQPNISFEEKLSMQIESTFIVDARDRVGVIYYKDGGKYFGVIQEGMPHGLGITQYSDGKFDAGWYQNGLLQGMGRLMMGNGDICEGYIQEGQISGKGFFYKKQTDTWVFGDFKGPSEIEIMTKGKGFPLEEIIEWKRNAQSLDLPVVELTIPNDLFFIPLLQAPPEDPRARMKRSPSKTSTGSLNSSLMMKNSIEKITHDPEEYRQLLKFKIAKLDSNRSAKFKQQITEANNEDDDVNYELNPDTENAKFEKRLESNFKILEKTKASPNKAQSNLVSESVKGNKEKAKEENCDDLWQGVFQEDSQQKKERRPKVTKQQLITKSSSNKLPTQPKAQLSVSKEDSNKRSSKGSSEIDYIYKKVDSPSPKGRILHLENFEPKEAVELNPQITSGTDSSSRRQKRGVPSFDMGDGNGNNFFLSVNETPESPNTDRHQLGGENMQAIPGNPFRPQLTYTTNGINRASSELDSPEFSKRKSSKNEAGNVGQESDQQKSFLTLKHQRAQSAQQEGKEEDDYSVQSISRSELNLPKHHRFSASSNDVNFKEGDLRKQTLDDVFADLQFNRGLLAQPETSQANLDQPHNGEGEEKNDFETVTFRNINQSGLTIEEGAAGTSNREDINVDQKVIEAENAQETGVRSENEVLDNYQNVSARNEVSTNTNAAQRQFTQIPFERVHSFGQKLTLDNPNSSKGEKSDNQLIKEPDLKTEEYVHSQGENILPSNETAQGDQHQDKVVEAQESIVHLPVQNNFKDLKPENKNSSSITAYNYKDSPTVTQIDQLKKSHNSNSQGVQEKNPIQLQDTIGLPKEKDTTPNTAEKKLPSLQQSNIGSNNIIKVRNQSQPVLESPPDLSNAGLISLISPDFTEKTLQQGSYISPNQTQSTFGANLDSLKTTSKDFRRPSIAVQEQSKYFLSPAAQKQRHNPADSYGSAKTFSEQTSSQPSMPSNKLLNSYISNSYLSPRQFVDKEYQNQKPLSDSDLNSLQFISSDGVFDHKAAHQALDEVLRRSSVFQMDARLQQIYSPSSLSAYFAQYQSPHDFDHDELIPQFQGLQATNAKSAQNLLLISNTRNSSDLNPTWYLKRNEPSVSYHSSQQYSPNGLNQSRLTQSQNHLIEHTSSLPGLSCDRKIVQNLSPDDIPPSKRIGGLQLSPERRSANPSYASPNLSRTRYQLQTPDKANSSLANKASSKLDSKYLAGSIVPMLAKENQSNVKHLSRDEPSDLQDQKEPLLCEKVSERAPDQRPILDSSSIGLKKEVPLLFAQQPANSRKRTTSLQDRSEPPSNLFEKKNWAVSADDDSELTDSRLESSAITPLMRGNQDNIFSPGSWSGRTSGKDQQPILVDEEDKFETAKNRFQDLLKLDLEKFKKHIENGLFEIEEATDESLGRTLQAASFAITKQNTQSEENNDPLSDSRGVPQSSSIRANAKEIANNANLIDMRSAQPIENAPIKGVEGNISSYSGKNDSNIPRELRADILAVEDRKLIKKSPTKAQSIENTAQNVTQEDSSRSSASDKEAIEMLNSITQRIKQDIARRKEQNKKLFGLY